MDLIKVNEVHAEATKRVLAGFYDVLPTEATPVWTLTHWAVNLGSQNNIVALGHGSKVEAGDFFAEAGGIDIGSVEKVNAGIERELEVVASFFPAHVPALRAHRPFRQFSAAVAHAAEAEARYGDTSVTQRSILHRLRF